MDCPEPNFETIFAVSYYDKCPVFIPVSKIRGFFKWSPVSPDEVYMGFCFKGGWFPRGMVGLDNVHLVISTLYDDFKRLWPQLSYPPDGSLHAQLQIFYKNKYKMGKI